jgi:hypothetical protein
MIGKIQMSPDVSFSYQLIVDRGGDGSYAGYLAIRESTNLLDGPPRYGIRFDIPGTFRSGEELNDVGARLFARFLKGEASPAAIPVEKEKVRGYRIVGSARFQVVDLKWEPVLELKKIEEPNRGKRQTVTGHGTVFPRNLFRSPELAARFAFDFGKGMVIGSLSGLEI